MSSEWGQTNSGRRTNAVETISASSFPCPKFLCQFSPRFLPGTTCPHFRHRPNQRGGAEKDMRRNSFPSRSTVPPSPVLRAPSLRPSAPSAPPRFTRPAVAPALHGNSIPDFWLPFLCCNHPLAKPAEVSWLRPKPRETRRSHRIVPVKASTSSNPSPAPRAKRSLDAARPHHYLADAAE